MEGSKGGRERRVSSGASRSTGREIHVWLGWQSVCLMVGGYFSTHHMCCSDAGQPAEWVGHVVNE